MLLDTDTTETSLPLELVVDQLGVGGVTGLSPTVAIRLVGAPTLTYLDWDDYTFKTSGWSTQFQIMTEIGNGTYQQLLNVSAVVDVLVGMWFVAEYSASSGSNSGVDNDTIHVNQVMSQTTFLRKFATNRLDEAHGDPGTLTLYDDDALTEIAQWNLLDEEGNAIEPTIGTPARRSPATGNYYSLRYKPKRKSRAKK